MEPEVAYILTHIEKRRATLFKWSYSLETAGFSREEAQRLVFFKWLLHRKGQRAQDLANREGVCSVLTW